MQSLSQGKTSGWRVVSAPRDACKGESDLMRDELPRSSSAVNIAERGPASSCLRFGIEVSPRTGKSQHFRGAGSGGGAFARSSPRAVGGCHVVEFPVAPCGLVPMNAPPVPPVQPVEPLLPGEVPSAAVLLGCVAGSALLPSCPAAEAPGQFGCVCATTGWMVAAVTATSNVARTQVVARGEYRAACR